MCRRTERRWRSRSVCDRSPRMAENTIKLANSNSRHRERPLGAVARLRGKKPALRRHGILDQDGSNQFGVHPATRQFRVPVGQFTEAQQGFPTLDDPFDWPAPAVEGRDRFGGKALGRQRRQDRDPLGSVQGAGLHRLAVALGGRLRPPPGLFRRFRRLAQRHQAQPQGGLVGAVIVNLHRPLGRRAADVAQMAKQVEGRCAAGRPQTPRMPAEAHDERAARRGHRSCGGG